MNLTVTAGNPFAQPLPALVVFAFQNERVAAPASLRSVLRRLNSKEFDGSEKQTILLHNPGRPGRVLLAGLGKRDEFTLEKLRRATGPALKKLRDAGFDRAAVA